MLSCIVFNVLRRVDDNHQLISHLRYFHMVHFKQLYLAHVVHSARIEFSYVAKISNV